MKSDHLKEHRFLFPLLIPEVVWFDISMDFVMNLQVWRSKSIIFVIVDHLTKKFHLRTLAQKFTTTKVVELFMYDCDSFYGKVLERNP